MGKKYTDRRIDDVHRLMDSRIAAMILLAEHMEAGIQDRFEDRDRAIESAGTKPELQGILARLNLMENASANLQGRLWTLGVGVPVLITLVSIGISVAIHFIK
jgi:hypothetical protein